MSENNEKETQISSKRSMPKDRDISRNNNNTMTDSNKSDMSRKSLNKHLRKPSFTSNNNSRVSSTMSVDHLPRNASGVSNDRFGGDLCSDDSHELTYEDNSSEDEENDNLQENFDPFKHFHRKEDSLRTPFQLKCYYFFEEPMTKWGRAFVVFSSTCTIAVVVMICIISWPTMNILEPKTYKEIWFPLDIIVLITFTIEYLGRFYASINKWKFFYQPMNLIDLISIIPFYVHLLTITSVHQSLLQVIRVLRLFRLLRLFRAAKYSAGFNITAKVFQRSAYQIVMVSVYLLVILLTSSALMFYIERGEFDKRNLTWYRIGEDGNSEISPFQSIIHSFWWSIVTLTTTGYGDAVPVTGPGKLIAALTMTCGILVIALPTSIIGSNFNAEWAFQRRLQFQLRVHKTREQAKSLIEIGENKNKKIKLLQNQNKTMLEGLAEIQERLSEINPPRYYRKYKNLQIKHIEALDKITELENKLERWKRIAKNLGSFNNYESPPDDKSDADQTVLVQGKRSKWKWKNAPFRTSSQLSMRKAATELDDKDNSVLKSKGILHPFRTLSNKIGKSATSITTRKRQPSGPITSEMISSPTELRHTFNPIIDSERDFTRRSSRPMLNRTSSEPSGDSNAFASRSDKDESNIDENNVLVKNQASCSPEDNISTNKANQDNIQKDGIEIIIDDQNTRSVTNNNTEHIENSKYNKDTI